MSEIWDNPLFPLDERLEMAKGGVIFRDKVIENLRGQLEAAKRDAARYQWWRNWVFRAGMDGLPSCTYLADVEDPSDIDSALDATLSQTKEQS